MLFTFIILIFNLLSSLLRILHLSNTRVSVFPEVEEFLIILDGFPLPAFLIVDLTEHVEGFGADVAMMDSARCKECQRAEMDKNESKA